MKSKNFTTGKVIRFGTSYAITLPYRFVRANGIKRGDTVRRTINGNAIVIDLEGKE